MKNSDPIPWFDVPRLRDRALNYAISDATEMLRTIYKPLIDQDGIDALGGITQLLNTHWMLLNDVLQAWREHVRERPTRVPNPAATGLADASDPRDAIFWELPHLERTAPNLHAEFIEPMIERHPIAWFAMLTIGCAYRGDSDSAIEAARRLQFLGKQRQLSQITTTLESIRKDNEEARTANTNIAQFLTGNAKYLKAGWGTSKGGQKAHMLTHGTPGDRLQRYEEMQRRVNAKLTANPKLSLTAARQRVAAEAQRKGEKGFSLKSLKRHTKDPRKAS